LLDTSQNHDNDSDDNRDEVVKVDNTKLRIQVDQNDQGVMIVGDNPLKVSKKNIDHIDSAANMFSKQSIDNIRKIKKQQTHREHSKSCRKDWSCSNST